MPYVPSLCWILKVIQNLTKFIIVGRLSSLKPDWWYTRLKIDRLRVKIVNFQFYCWKNEAFSKLIIFRSHSDAKINFFITWPKKDKYVYKRCRSKVESYARSTDQKYVEKVKISVNNFPQCVSRRMQTFSRTLIRQNIE